MSQLCVLERPFRVRVSHRSNLSPAWPVVAMNEGGYRPGPFTYTAPAGVEVWDPTGTLDVSADGVSFELDGPGLPRRHGDLALFFREGARFYEVRVWWDRLSGGTRVTSISECSPGQMAHSRRFRIAVPESWFPPDGGGNCADSEVWREWRWPDGTRFYDRFPDADVLVGWLWPDRHEMFGSP